METKNYSGGSVRLVIVELFMLLLFLCGLKQKRCSAFHWCKWFWSNLFSNTI